MCKTNSKLIDIGNNEKHPSAENGNKTVTCDEARSQCDRLYSVLSTVEEDCKTYRIYLGCLNMLKSTQSLCQADFHYWMMLSTTEKLITEKCSPGETSAIEPPRDLFNSPITPKLNKTNKIPSLPTCLDSIHTSIPTKNQYHSCAIFAHPNLITFAGERQTCRLRGAWPLVNNRFISVQVSGEQYSQVNFLDSTTTAITQVSIILKPDGKCLGDLAVPLLIYSASASIRLARLFPNGRRDMHQSLISIKSLEANEYHEKVELSFGHINSRVIISRTSVASGESSLSVSVLLPSQVAHARPRSRQQALVRELCSLGCPPAESVDDTTVLSRLSITPKSSASDFCNANGLRGSFFDSCYLMFRLIDYRPSRSLENYISTSITHVQNNFAEFSKLISDNFSIDLRARSNFHPFKPLWKIRQTDAQSVRSKKSTMLSLNILLTMMYSSVVLVFLSTL